MASVQRSFPSFGVARKQGITYVDFRVKVIDDVSKAEGSDGDMVLNALDNKLYIYYNYKWSAVAFEPSVPSSEDQTPPSSSKGQASPNDLILSAKDFPSAKGGSVRILSGSGGTDGDISFEIGHEPSMVLKKNGDIFVHGSINSPILSTKLDEADFHLFKMKGTRATFQINIESLVEGEKRAIVLKNSSIREGSMIMVSASAEEGVPIVWVSNQSSGEAQINFYSAVDELKGIKIFVCIENMI